MPDTNPSLYRATAKEKDATGMVRDKKEEE
jgi:hypothetical protein